MADDVQSPPATTPVEANGHVESEVEIIRWRQDERPIHLEMANGTVMNCTIREMNGDDLAWWTKQIGRRVQVRRDGKMVKSDFRGMHADLIHLCLYDQQGKRVNKDVIRSLGAKAQNRLFSICQDINGLNDKIEEAEGKD